MLAFTDAQSQRSQLLPSTQALAQLLGAGSTTGEIEQNLNQILRVTRLTFDLPAGADKPTFGPPA